MFNDGCFAVKGQVTCPPLGFLGGQTRKAFRSSLVVLLPMSGCISRAILLLLTFA